MLSSFRIAMTGAAATPGGATEMAHLFGPDRTAARLTASLDRLKAAGFAG